MFQEIPITRDCINRGEMDNATGCPLAHALGDADMKNPTVYPTMIFCGGLQFEVGTKLNSWLQFYDMGFGVFDEVVVLDYDRGTAEIKGDNQNAEGEGEERRSREQTREGDEKGKRDYVARTIGAHGDSEAAFA